METKQAIVQLVEALPAELLDEVLACLRELEKRKSAALPLSAHLSAILTEDREVLTRLAT